MLVTEEENFISPKDRFAEEPRRGTGAFLNGNVKRLQTHASDFSSPVDQLKANRVIHRANLHVKYRSKYFR